MYKKLIFKIRYRISRDGFFSVLIIIFKRLHYKIDKFFFFRLRMNLYLNNSMKLINSSLNAKEIRRSTLAYVESMRLKTPGLYGRYRYCSSQNDALLYASVFAALTRSMYGDLNSLTLKEKNEWVNYIMSYQEDDGIFRDLIIDCKLSRTAMWWGELHLTYLTLMALSCLEAEPVQNIPSIKLFKNYSLIKKWFLALKITKRPSLDINAHAPWIYVMLLQYARDLLNLKWVNKAIHEVIKLLNSEIDPETGLWGTKDKAYKAFYINEGVKIGYHFWIFYFYDNLPIPHAKKVIDNLLSTQNPLGGFDISLNSSACDDIDTIDPLCRMLLKYNYRKEEIVRALELSVPWVLANRNLDGGFVFKRDEAFQYGHVKMLSKRNESNMFATWFRSLSLAYIGKTLPNHFLSVQKWHLPKIPGAQFW